MSDGTLAESRASAELARAVARRRRRCAARPSSASRGVCTDSRRPRPGCLFVAIRGERFDGHDFVAEAAAGGAAGLVVRAGAGRRLRVGRRLAVIEVEDTLRALGDAGPPACAARHRVPLVAVTGSNGKTTTKELLAAALAAAAATGVLKTEGNFNNQIGVPLTLFRLERAHRLRRHRDGHERAGRDRPPHRDLRARRRRSSPASAAAHPEGLGDIDGVARAKGELFAGLRRRRPARAVNLDDDAHRAPCPRRPAA